MGKLLHKLIQGILPSCLFTASFLKQRASSRRLPYIKQYNYKPAASPESPSSPSPSTDHGRVAYLMEAEQSTYYYSYSEDDQGMAGHGDTSPVSVERIESGSPHDNNSHHCMPKEFQHDIHHHHHSHLCQHHENHRQHDDAPHDGQYGKLKEHVQHQKPRREGCKRKSLVLDEGDDEINNNDGGDDKPKRQKRANVRCELPECISEIVGRGSAIVQYSYQEPHLDFWESMVDMIVSNGLWDVGRQESLLLCYLTLNDPHLYTTICASFLQALKDLHSSLVILEGG